MVRFKKREVKVAVAPISIASKSHEAPMSDAERKMRVDLADCYRLIAINGMDDLLATHISARVPGPDQHFLINPYGLLFSQVTATNLIKVDLEGNILSNSPYGINPAGFVIHSAIHGTRPDVVCVIHTHTIAGMVISCLEEGLLPLSQKSLRFFNRIAYHDYEGKSDDLDERSRLRRDIGHKNALILRNHGLLPCGASIGHAYHAMLNLEKSCNVQLEAVQSGGKLIQLSLAVQEHAARQHDRDDVPGQAGRPDLWPALLTMLDKIDSSYRD
jgi:ribulose-5-phosphate 4-epimerase/fuculose-1-phosphate aldolase